MLEHLKPLCVQEKNRLNLLIYKLIEDPIDSVFIDENNMKTQLRKIFWFILRYFEKGDEPYSYKPLNRTILIIVGFLFIALSTVTVFFSIDMEGYGYLIPVIVFSSVGLVSLTVGFLGSDRAVSKIWGNR